MLNKLLLIVMLNWRHPVLLNRNLDSDEDSPSLTTNWEKRHKNSPIEEELLLTHASLVRKDLLSIFDRTAKGTWLSYKAFCGLTAVCVFGLGGHTGPRFR